MVLLHRMKWLAVIAGTFWAAAWALTEVSLWRGDDGERGPTEVRRRVESRHPQLVMLGNSMVADNIDGEFFSRSTGVRTQRVYQHGSASAWWYLTLAKDLAAVSRPPSVVVLFFRDHFLTHPSFRVLGPFAYRLQEHEAWQDPEVYRRAYRPALGALAPLYRDWSLFRNRDQEKVQLESATKRALERGLGIPVGSVDQAIEVVFTDDNLDPEQRTIRQEMAEAQELDPALFDFDARLEESFLPAMIEVARERGIELVLVRMKKHRTHPDAATAERLVRYGADLDRYLAREQVPYLDFSDDVRIEPDFFSWGDHFTPEGRAAFTKLLIADLAARGLLPKSG